MSAFVLQYVSEQVNLCFKVIRLAEVAASECICRKSSAHQLNHILNSNKNKEGPVTKTVLEFSSGIVKSAKYATIVPKTGGLAGLASRRSHCQNEPTIHQTAAFKDWTVS